MKMYDAGEKMSESMDAPMDSSKNEKYYPHLDLDNKQLPEISKWQVGKKYTLVVEVKATRKSMREKEGSEAKESMCFEVQRIGVKPGNISGDQKVNKIVDNMYKEEGEKEEK